MKHCYRSAFSVLFALLLALAFCIPSSFAGLNCVPLSGKAPVIDGILSAGEWTGVPQLTIATPIQTDIYCRNDTQNLYILVNALGDTTNDRTESPCTAITPFSCDECLLVFGDPNQTTNYLAEVWGTGGNVIGTNVDFPANGEVAIGYTDHKFYEWKIPLTYINATPGQTIDFSSPSICKSSMGLTCHTLASMPYDGSTGRDNVWPAGVDLNNRTTWDTIILAESVFGVPALTEWGIIVSMVLAGLVAIFFLRKRKSTH
jgi:hypothetical protein